MESTWRSMGQTAHPINASMVIIIAVIPTTLSTSIPKLEAGWFKPKPRAPSLILPVPLFPHPGCYVLLVPPAK